MCKLINVFEQDDAGDKVSIEVSSHTVSVGISKRCSDRRNKVKEAEKKYSRGQKLRGIEVSH